MSTISLVFATLDIDQLQYPSSIEQPLTLAFSQDTSLQSLARSFKDCLPNAIYLALDLNVAAAAASTERLVADKYHWRILPPICPVNTPLIKPKRLRIKITKTRLGLRPRHC
jgi:hypothetical protein